MGKHLLFLIFLCSATVVESFPLPKHFLRWSLPTAEEEILGKKSTRHHVSGLLHSHYGEKIISAVQTIVRIVRGEAKQRNKNGGKKSIKIMEARFGNLVQKIQGYKRMI